MMAQFFGVAAAVCGALGVGAGAFGAHVLKGGVTPELLAVWKTGANYHLIHAMALGLVALEIRSGGDPVLGSSRFAGYAFVVGIVLFSGSLYVMTVTGVRWLGAITPLGGLALIAGWCALGVSFMRSHSG